MRFHILTGALFDSLRGRGVVPRQPHKLEHGCSIQPRATILISKDTKIILISIAIKTQKSVFLL